MTCAGNLDEVCAPQVENWMEWGWWGDGAVCQTMKGVREPKQFEKPLHMIENKIFPLYYVKKTLLLNLVTI